MALDITAIIILVLCFIRGFSRGLVVALFSIIAILLGILVTLKLSQTFASWLLAKGFTTVGWAPIISYIVLFTGVVILVRLIGRMVQNILEGIFLGIFNKIAGGLIYILIGAILWSSFLWIAANMHLFPKKTIKESKTYPFLYTIAPIVFDQASKILPFAKDTFANLQVFFDTINTKK